MICAVTYHGFVIFKDQSHALDLLVAYIGRIPWIKDVIRKVTFVWNKFHKLPILEELQWESFPELADDFNRNTRSFNTDMRNSVKVVTQYRIRLHTLMPLGDDDIELKKQVLSAENDVNAYNEMESTYFANVPIFLKQL